MIACGIITVKLWGDPYSWRCGAAWLLLLAVFALDLRRGRAALSPKLLKRTEKIEILKGQRYHETCTVIEGDIPITFRWLKNGQTLSSNTHEAIIRRLDDFSSSLIIDSVTEYSSGNYSCVVSNAAGMDSFTATLQINVSPYWTRQPVDVSALAGKDAEITCQAEGSPAPRITWKRAKGVLPENPQDVRTDSRVRISAEGTLSIQRSVEEDEGFYMCQASNGIGEVLKKTVKVDILVPPRISEPFQAINQKKGTPVEIKCNITGDLPLQVTWKKEHTILGSKDRVMITQTEVDHSVISILRLENPESEDNALYQCSAKNQHGRSDMRARLIVVEVPGVPESVSLLQAWSRSVRIGWKMPYNGNSPITKIIVEYQKDKDERAKVKRKEFGSTDTSAILEGLRPWVRYRVRVAAQNAVGIGHFSEKILVLTREEEPVSAPSNFRIESVRATTARVSWQHLRHQDWNGQILGYYVGYKGYDEGSPFALRSIPMNSSGPGQTFLLTGLQKVFSYKVVVSAFNAAGVGPPTDPLSFQTKSGVPPSTPRLRLISRKATIAEVQILPDSSEDEIEDYLLHVKWQHRTNWEELPLPSTGIHWVGGLMGDTQYQMFVTARNVFGTSEPSQVVSFLTTKPTFLELEEEPLWAKMSVILPCAASAALVLVVCCVACCMAKRLSRPPKQEGVAANDFSYTRPSTSRSESACFSGPQGLPVSMQHRPPASLPRNVRTLQYSEPRAYMPIEEPKYECVLEEMKTFIGSTDRQLVTLCRSAAPSPFFQILLKTAR